MPLVDSVDMKGTAPTTHPQSKGFNSMHSYCGRKKAAIVAAIAAIAFVLTAATAFAAPVLQPGTTSYPGMHGTCTNCHTYAKPAS
ncbi:MAG: hypothetical protein ACXV48_07900, partial [Halobacteriota archaeon]